MQVCGESVKVWTWNKQVDVILKFFIFQTHIRKRMESYWKILGQGTYYGHYSRKTILEAVCYENWARSSGENDGYRLIVSLD